MTQPRNEPTDCDVLVVGGGPVGACLANLLVREERFDPRRIVVLERELPVAPTPSDPVDLRVVALSRASERILRAAGAWEAIARVRLCPYERMHVWHASQAPRSPGELVFDAAEVAEANLGHIVENRVVQHALLEAFVAAGGRIVTGRIEGLDFAAEHVAVRHSSGSLSTRLVVGADGARSQLRDLLDIPAAVSDYGQHALVAVVATERPHEQAAWQRFLGVGTLAFLPLADDTSSIVWSIASEAAERLRTAPVDEFEAELAAASDGVLGKVTLRSERATFPLRKLGAASYVRERGALVGDAAHVVHPLAGQGVNLGLLDAAALSELLGAARREGEDPGALRILRRYERWRRSENALMSASMDAFNRFLATGSGPVSRLAQRGLALVGRNAIVKRFFVERALGTGGELPRAARG